MPHLPFPLYEGFELRVWDDLPTRDAAEDFEDDCGDAEQGNGLCEWLAGSAKPKH